MIEGATDLIAKLSNRVANTKPENTPLKFRDAFNYDWAYTRNSELLLEVRTFLDLTDETGDYRRECDKVEAEAQKIVHISVNREFVLVNGYLNVMKWFKQTVERYEYSMK